MTSNSDKQTNTIDITFTDKGVRLWVGSNTDTWGNSGWTDLSENDLGILIHRLEGAKRKVAALAAGNGNEYLY